MLELFEGRGFDDGAVGECGSVVVRLVGPGDGQRRRPRRSHAGVWVDLAHCCVFSGGTLRVYGF